ncbi:MAG: excisionase family DNA-binding protein [Micrococcales bacterium]|nr:excisionase family DNA-binding protein [Micrococcales bacterium]
MTTQREAKLAGQILAGLEGPEGVLTVERHGERVEPLPPELGQILQEVLRMMARGGTVTIGTLPKELTTTTAAAVLSISRPTLMGMIKEGRLPAHKVGSHTRLYADDVLAERSARRERERAAFAELRDIDY